MVIDDGVFGVKGMYFNFYMNHRGVGFTTRFDYAVLPVWLVHRI